MGDLDDADIVEDPHPVSKPVVDLNVHENERWRRDQLFVLALDLAPTDESKHFVVSIYNRMVGEKCENKDILLTLLDMINSGLRYGNWPTPPTKSSNA